METLEFNVYRYFLVLTEQMSLFQKAESEKEKIMYDFFETLHSNKKVVRVIGKKKSILYLTQKYDNNIFLCKYAKEKPMKKFQEGENDIESIVETNFPYIYMFFDLKRQLILIQNKSSVFEKVEYAKNSIGSFFQKTTDIHGYNFTIDELTYEQAFWECISGVDGVYELTFDLKSPNLFGGILKTNEFLKKIKEIYNSTETQIKYKNEKGSLSVRKDEVEDTVKYITGGGGRWKIKARKNRSRKTFKSSENVKKISMANNLEVDPDITYRNIKEIIEQVDELLGDINNDKKNN
mgnify:FL=1